MKEKLVQLFYQLFQNQPIVAFAPGRINLIGEHTDYQEGFVFPAAVAQGIYVAIAKNDLNHCRLYSFDFEEEFTFPLDSIFPKKGHWANYVMGMLSQFRQAGISLQSFDMVIGGTIPVGAGLSSSAALSIGFGTAISSLFNYQVSKNSLVRYAQKSEHLFAGVNCGIMDPYASTFGAKGKALLLDCRSNSHEEIQVDLGNYSLILVNSKVKHSLADTAYNKRREACEDSVRLLQAHFPNIKTLRDLNTTDLGMIETILPAQFFPKAKHIITENHRVHLAAKALQEQDLIEFGQLLNQSHQSLSEDYEVSCAELDELAATAQSMDFVLGSRMMGGGFGGCTLNLVHREGLEEFKKVIQENYESTFFIIPEFIEVTLSEGASLLIS